METLGKLFGSIAKVKIMRMFLLNPGQGFENRDVADRARISNASARSEIGSLAGTGFITKKSFMKEIHPPIRKGKPVKQKIKTKRVSGWFLNEQFEYRGSLQDLLIDAEFITRDDLVRRFKKAGKIKLMLTAGVFTRNQESRLDIFIVGDNLKRNVLEKTIRNLESEIGKELEYAVFESPEFLYRANMYDKLVRDVIDAPFDAIIDLGLLQQVPKIS